MRTAKTLIAALITSVALLGTMSAAAVADPNPPQDQQLIDDPLTCADYVERYGARACHHAYFQRSCPVTYAPLCKDE